MKITTQHELARKLGLSRSTVAEALNPKSRARLSEATKARVLEAAKRLNYRPDRNAQTMRRGRSGLIGMFHFGGLYQVAAERAWYATHAIEAAGYQVLAIDASNVHGGAESGCEAMLGARVEGLLVAGLNVPLSLAEFKPLQAARIPIVALSGNEIPEITHVRSDTFDAFLGLTTHLLKLGRRRLLLLLPLAYASGQPAAWSGLERVAGFQAALKAAAIPVVDRFSKTRKGAEGRVTSLEWTSERFDPYRQAFEAMTRVLQDAPLPDAVICANDDWAIGALAAIRQAGLRVPADIAITGFDDTSIGRFLEVPLTTVAQPCQAMSERAVDILVKKMLGQLPPSGVIKFPCELVIRASCGSSWQAA